MTQNTEKWGKATAKSRYGGGHKTFPAPKAANEPQFPEDSHGADYNNDAPSNWVRGMPSAEGKPGFDRTKLKRA